MIGLPRGCTVNYPVYVEIDELNADMVAWYKDIGGLVTQDTFYNHRGQLTTKLYVSYGRGKRCYYHSNGMGHVRLHFQGEDAPVATMFIMKFIEHVLGHNMQENQENRNKLYLNWA